MSCRLALVLALAFAGCGGRPHPDREEASVSKSKYFSPTLQFAAGKPLKFSPWIPAQGPTGRRNMVLGLLLRASYQVDVAGAVIQGEDLARLFNRIRIATHGGDRWNLPGDASRIMSQALVGPARAHESADIGIANNVTGQYALWIPFAKPRAHRPEDFAIAADVLREVEITCPSAAALDIGASDVTIDSCDYSVLALCREVDGVEIPMFDVVGESAMETLTQGRIDVGGGYLAEVLAYAEGASGGGAMTNWTSHFMPSLQSEPLTADDTKFLYALTQAAAPNDGGTPGGQIYNDPVMQNRARVVHMLDGANDKLVDHPFVAKSLVVKAVNTVADVKLIHRVIYPTPGPERERVARAYRIRNGRVKTKGKSKRSPAAWGGKARFMPLSGQ